MKNILVPIDFSDASYNAGKYAASLGNVFDAEVMLIYAYLPPAAVDEMSASLIPDPGNGLRQANEDLMQMEIKNLSRKYTAKIKGMVKVGVTPLVIEEAAKENHADIIIMGMKGKGKSNSVFGSTTTIMTRKSFIPELVVPENAKYKGIDTITLASDFDEETKLSTYTLLRQLAKKNDAFIQIVNVRKQITALTADEVAGKLNTNLAFPELKHQFYTIKHGDVNKGIEDFLETHPSDLLVMLAHKHTIIEKLFGTIHTKKMSYKTKIPLLVLQDK